MCEKRCKQITPNTSSSHLVTKNYIVRMATFDIWYKLDKVGFQYLVALLLIVLSQASVKDTVFLQF